MDKPSSVPDIQKYWKKFNKKLNKKRDKSRNGK